MAWTWPALKSLKRARAAGAVPLDVMRRALLLACYWRPCLRSRRQAFAPGCERLRACPLLAWSTAIACISPALELAVVARWARRGPGADDESCEASLAAVAGRARSGQSSDEPT